MASKQAMTTKVFRKRMNDQIIFLLRQGKLTLEEISDQAGCSLWHVFDIARKNGLRRKDSAAQQKEGN